MTGANVLVRLLARLLRPVIREALHTGLHSELVAAAVRAADAEVERQRLIEAASIKALARAHQVLRDRGF